MNKRPPASEVSKPPVRMRLLYLSPQELKNFRISIKRQGVLPDTESGPLIRNLGDPKDLHIHRPDEGQTPIFDRDDIVVNLDFEERIFITMTESPKRQFLSKCVERKTSSWRDRRSRSHSRQRSPVRKYNSRSRSRSTGRYGDYSGNSLKEHSRNRSTTNFDRNSGYRLINDNKVAPPSSQKSNRRSSSKERRRYFSRDRVRCPKHQKSPPRSYHHRSSHYDSDRRFRRTPSPHQSYYRQRKRSRSPMYKRKAAYSTHYRKSQERRSRSPYRDQYTKYRDHRKRSRSPYSKEKYKSPDRKVCRECSCSPPKYSGPPEAQGRHNPHPYMPPHFGPSWPRYEQMSPYVRYIIPEGYVPVLPPRVTGNMNMTPRMPQRLLPVYNTRVIPKIAASDTKTSTSNMNASATVSSSAELSTVSKDFSDNVPTICSKPEKQSTVDSVNTSRESIDTLLVVTTTQENNTTN